MITQITDHIYISDYDSSCDRPRLGYIKGTRFNIMIDAGNSPAHFNSFMDECKMLGLESPDFIILTHWHWDHVFGLSNTNIPAISSTLTQVKLIEMSEWKWDDESMMNRLITGEDIEFCDINMRLEYDDCCDIKVRCADMTFVNELNINLGDCTCNIRRIENDHANDSVVAYVPEDKLIFLGDIISPDYHHGSEHYTKEKFYSLRENLLSYDFDYAVHGHTEVFTMDTLNKFFIEAQTNESVK